jgi:hypothetical protein
MGMMICEAIETLLFTRSYGTADIAKSVAIDTMRKYQKIQEILKDDTYYEKYGNNAEKFIVSAISEVLEDGKHF